MKGGFGQPHENYKGVRIWIRVVPRIGKYGAYLKFPSYSSRAGQRRLYKETLSDVPHQPFDIAKRLIDDFEQHV